MVEVGTTNRTRIRDFEEAIRSSTGALLAAHWSNYTISGFVERVALSELVALGERYGIPVIHDLGSGILGDPSALGLAGEMSVNESVAAGAAVSTFSGDKILGGPQAGIAVGRESIISRMRANPLTRALRPGKLTLAALQTTLFTYLNGEETSIPVIRMITESSEALGERAAALAARLSDRIGTAAAVTSVELESRVGGGAAPERVLPSRGVELEPSGGVTAEGLAAALLEGTPPVIVRTRENRILLDLRTVAPDEESDLTTAIEGALGLR
jgi:L-seryl-tRNA(Ser) seleniumtransferase